MSSETGNGSSMFTESSGYSADKWAKTEHLRSRQDVMGQEGRDGRRDNTYLYSFKSKSKEYKGAPHPPKNIHTKVTSGNKGTREVLSAAMRHLRHVTLQREEGSFNSQFGRSRAG